MKLYLQAARCLQAAQFASNLKSERSAELEVLDEGDISESVLALVSSHMSVFTTINYVADLTTAATYILWAIVIW